MLQYGLGKNDREEKRTQQRSKKFGQLLLIIGILLLLNICYVSAVNSTDVTNLSPPQTLNITSIPVIQTLNVTSVNPTQPPAEPAVLANATLNVTSIPTTLVAETTLITTVPSGITNADPTLIRILRPNAAIDQFTLRAGKRVSQAEKEKAAANYKKTREAFLMQIPSKATQAAGRGIVGAAPALDPGAVPHYFGPYPNWANSPMPMGHISNITVDAGGAGYSAATTITIEDVYFTGSGATATAIVSGGVITGITVTNPGTSYTAPVVIITDGTGTGAAATASIGGLFTSGIRKFVDTLPGLNAAGANNLGQYIPVAIPDTTTYTTPPSDYY
jgi:hypothetical protein